jgi:hypothetical protein
VTNSEKKYSENQHFLETQATLWKGGLEIQLLSFEINKKEKDGFGPYFSPSTDHPDRSVDFPMILVNYLVHVDFLQGLNYLVCHEGLPYD